VICDDAVAIGFAAVFKLGGEKFSSIKLHQIDKGKTICYKSSTVKGWGKLLLLTQVSPSTEKLAF
jgi:hypothetical protein